MNWNEIEGKWDQWAGKVKEQWGKFTDDDLMAIGGKKDQLLGKLKERYGYSQRQCEKELDSFLQNCDSSDCNIAMLG